MTDSYEVVTWTRPLLFMSSSTIFSITELTINILEIAQKQLQGYRDRPKFALSVLTRTASSAFRHFQVGRDDVTLNHGDRAYKVEFYHIHL